MTQMIHVYTNANSLAALFGEVAAKQFPYASAQALTTLAFNAQKAEKMDLQKEFTLRNKFSISGIQVNKAEKSDWPNQQSEVGIDEGRSYLIDHVTGGKREGGTHGRAIIAKTSLRAKNGRVPKKNRPGALIKLAKRPNLGRTRGSKNGQHSTPLPFIIKTTSKWNNEVLVQRSGIDRYPLQILYAFKRGVRIKREFEMDVIAAKVVTGQYHKVFSKALSRALATAKPKAERDASGSRGKTIPDGR